MDHATAQKLIARGYVAIVYVHYSYSDKEKGDLVSKHKSYEAAERAARSCRLWGVRFLDEIA